MREKAVFTRNGYVVAVVAVAAATVVRWLLEPLLGNALAFLTFYIAVAASAWYCGLKSALVAAALGAVAAVALFIPTHPGAGWHQIVTAQWDDWLRYCVLTATFALFGEAKRSALARAEVRRETLQVTLSSIGDGVIATDTEGNVTSLNPVAEELTGWKQRDALGIPLEDVFQIVNEDTRAPVNNPVAKVLQHGHIVALANHTVLIAKDGTERPIDDSAAPIRDAAGNLIGVILIFRDVTNLRTRERALRASEARKSAVLRTALDAIVTIDHQGKIVDFNPAAERIFGFAQDDVIGREMADVIVPPAHRSNHRRGLTRFLATGEARVLNKLIEITAVRSDGTEFPVELAITMIGDAKQPMFTGYIRDISDRKKAEDVLRAAHEELEQRVAQRTAQLSEAHAELERRVAERTAELDEANRALQEADRRKDEFLATLAHELRNPLAPLVNGLQVMRLAGADADTVERARAMMERQLTQIIRLVDDLLDVNRISRGTFLLRIERANLADIVQQAIETCSVQIEQQQHRLMVALPPAPIYLDADAARLTQALCNLLVNAAKYTPKGGQIWLDVRRSGGDAIVSIKDSGVGIPSEMLEQVFEMFTQVDRSLETSQSGLGIGLTVVRRLVEMHGGSVQAKSPGLGKGSEFIVRLPVAAMQADDFARIDDRAPGKNGNHRILIADDNEDAAASLAMVLNMMGNETRIASDGLDALKIGATFAPEIVLLDIGMPNLNGYEAARRIRTEPWGQRLMLVALTGRSQDDDRLRSHEAGFDFHLVKPVEPEELAKLLAIATPTLDSRGRAPIARRCD